MKNLVVEKKLEVWNDVVERANQILMVIGKNFGNFVGRRTKGEQCWGD